MKTYDVVIIGAGLAGLQCAKLLGQQNTKVLLIDRKSDLSESIHTTGIFVRRTLEDFEFPSGSLGPPVRKVVLYSPAHKTLTLSSHHDEFRVGKMAILYQSLLQECLQANVDWRPSTHYLSSEALGTHSIVKLSTQKKLWSVKARCLIGADGAISKVAPDLGLDENKEWIVGSEEVWHGTPLDGEPHFDCFLDPRIAPGYLAWVVNDGEETHIGVGGYKTDFHPLKALKQFRQSLGPHIVDLSQATLIEKRGGRIPVGGILKNIANERGLLLGDASGAVSPLTAGGLDPCLRLSKLASQIVVERLRFDQPQTLKLFSGNLFRTRFTSRLWMRRILASIHQPLLTEALCAGLRLPIMRRLAHHIFFGRGSFPDIPFSALLEKN